MQVRRLKQADIIRTAFMPHEIVDVSRRRRSTPREVLGRHDDIEPAARAEEKVLALLTSCSVQQGSLVGDAVEYEDAYTGELKHGRITQMSGGTAIIRTITEREAGKNPKRIPKTRIACSFSQDQDGKPVCGYHRVEINQLAVHSDQPNSPGIGQLSAWICPTTGKQVYDAGFPGK